MNLRRLLIESVRSGTLAALAMVPFGLAFRLSGLRIGYYGPKFASLFVNEPTRPLLFIQHIVIGWISAVPLVALISSSRANWSPAAVGTLYGIAYYVLVNSLALPLYFGDRLPWQIGIGTVLPSLVIHIVFGVTVGLLARRHAPIADVPAIGHRRKR